MAHLQHQKHHVPLLLHTMCRMTKIVMTLMKKSIRVEEIRADGLDQDCDKTRMWFGLMCS